MSRIISASIRLARLCRGLAGWSAAGRRPTVDLLVTANYGLIIDCLPMFSRKQQKLLRQPIQLAILALFINVLIPGRVSAHQLPQAISGNSNAVIVQALAIQANPSSDLPSLPAVPDKPVAKKMVVRASAYSSTVDQCDGNPFITAAGTKVHDGIIAVNGLPFGTMVRIPDYYGDKIFTVEDRMNARWGNRRIDIWMPNRGAAMDWGVRTVTIEILAA
jgi:3D (Asp-Asp-Asp) domain-containing protein